MTTGSPRSIAGSADDLAPLFWARRARGLSRERLAALAGVSPRTVYAIEVEGVQPQRATRTVIAAALGCETSDLFPASSPLLNGEERPAGNGTLLETSARHGRHGTG